MKSFEINHLISGTADKAVPFISFSIHESRAKGQIPEARTLLSETIGWVAEDKRRVQTWSAPPGYLLRISGSCDYYISPTGDKIQFLGPAWHRGSLGELDRQVFLGPILVFALALRGTWCLHASALLQGDELFVFLGESGQGKSTLADHLASRAASGWRLVADDILPVRCTSEKLMTYPNFPQLKLPADKQPAPGLPEAIDVQKIFVLASNPLSDETRLVPLNPLDSGREILAHTAGTRMFPPHLLTRHLDFAAQAAKRAQFYSLDYPHSPQALEDVRKILEALC